jgi:hypothetical protein
LKTIFHIPSSESLCPPCSTEEDSLSHLFFRCIFARVAWRSSFWPLDSLAWSSISLLNWIKGIINPHSTFGIPLTDCHLFQIYASVFCELLWFVRNKVVHEGSILDISSLASSIRRTSLDHAVVWLSSSPLVKEFWSPPSAGSYKINFDTAIHELFSVQAAVCRDSKGKIVKAISQTNPPGDPNFGEPLVARLAASLAAYLKLKKKFSLVGDSMVVIVALNNPSITLN